MILTLTGHRPERLNGKEAEVKQWIKDKILELKPEKVISGMALGADQILCEVCMELNVPLVCAFPYKHKLHPVEQKFADYATEVYYQTPTWYQECYHDRDEWMVDHSDAILVVWDGIQSGGTYYTYKYAEKKEIEIYKM